MKTYSKIIETIFLVCSILVLSFSVYIMFIHGFSEGLSISVFGFVMLFWYFVRKFLTRKVEKMQKPNSNQTLEK